MAGKFMTITRCHVKAGSEAAARQLLEKELKTNDGSKHSEHVPGLVGFGLMKSRTDSSMYGVVSIWESEAALDNLAKTNPKAASGGGLPERLAAYCDGPIKGEGFYIESL